MDRRDFNTPLMDNADDNYIENVPAPSPPKHYKDIFFLFLFGVNIVCIVSVAILYGIVALSSGGDEVIKVADNGKQYDQTAEFTPSVSILLGMISTLAMAVVMTAIWIFTLSRIASYVLNAIMISMILVPIIFGFVLFAMGFFVFGATLIALSIFLLVLSLFIRPRMDFAATNLKVACGAVLHMPTIFGYALLAVGVQVLFSVVWGMAAVGYATSNNQTTIHSHGLVYDLDQCTTYVYGSTLDVASYGTLTCTGGTCRACVCDGTLVANHSCVTPKLYGWTYTWLLLSLFWTSAVVSNVVHCTTSAAVAKWWTMGYPSAAMVQEGFDAATTTSLGSICLGSLLVAVIRTLRTLLYFASRQLDKNKSSSGALRQLQSCCVGLLKYLLALMDRLVVYFNRYALCFVAIYHHDFRTASVSASSLFTQRGWSVLLNDDIIDVVLNIGHIIIGTTSMSVGYIYGRLSGLGHAYTVLLTVFGFAAGYLVSIVALSTISSAVATVYVCYVDNPDALRMSHPEMFVPLSDSWNKVFPPPARKSAASSPGGDSSKFIEGPASSTFEISFKDSNQPQQQQQQQAPQEVPKISRIRGSFGSLENAGRDSPSAMRSGATSASASTAASAAVSGGGPFSAGFAFLTSMFPGSQQGGQPVSSRAASGGQQAMPVMGSTRGYGGYGGHGGGAGYRNVSVAGGGYASLPVSDPTADRAAPAANKPGPWSAQGFRPDQQHQQQSQRRDAHQQYQATLPQRAPTQFQYTAQPPPHQQQGGPPHYQNHPHQTYPHHQGQHQHQHQHGEPMFSPQFASAINAIGAFTSSVSSSVFGNHSGPPAGYGYAPQGTGGGTGATPSASLMSVNLEESFAV